MNKYSMDRGFGRCIVLKKYGVSLKKYGNRTNDRIVAPQPAPGGDWGEGRVAVGEGKRHACLPESFWGCLRPCTCMSRS